VLSACGTGLGEIVAGEGILGLQRAFAVAGAQTVVMSLWPVEDESTRNWMRELYTRRLEQNLTTIESVHIATQTILEDRRRAGKSTHPFYWGAFIATGDWR
jgi:CHAT domain-containing protein